MEQNVTKKVNKIYKVLLILLIVGITLTSCSRNDGVGSNTNEGFQKGLNFETIHKPGTTPPLPDNRFSACKSDKSEFNIHFVILDFYYGGNFYEDIERELSRDSYPYFDIYFGDDYGNKYFVKRVNENFVSEKYRCNVIHDEYGHTSEIRFNYSEKLWIPKQVFVEESGLIYFKIYGENQRDDEPIYKCIESMSICYKVVGNKVILSDKDIK